MREVVVISGKGGVGKSTVTASLAVLFDKAKVRLTAIDCDVDAPNLSIILGTNIEDFMEIQASEKASVDLTKCERCGRCASVCEADAIITTEDGMPTIIPFLCEGCGACSIICPTSAISISRVKNGVIGMAKTPYGFPIVSGQLDMGESSSGHIVTAVKAKGRVKAEDSGSELILVDGPPGIGCPVIASIAGADYALVVTEPTPAARNSLDRILFVLNHFKIPGSAVINRYDLDPAYSEKIKDWIQTVWKTPVIEVIPSDDNVPFSLSKRMPVVEYAPDCKASVALHSLSNLLLKAI
jgi:MinD superfamily P-loop ATPase